MTTVFCDSQNAILSTKNQMIHERTKHFDMCYHFVRDIITCGDNVRGKISIQHDPVDMMTKSLMITRIEHCLKDGVCYWVSPSRIGREGEFHYEEFLISLEIVF